MEPIKTLFFGTPEFAATALKTLADNSRFQIIGVVTQPDRPTGRKKVLTPAPVKVVAQNLGIQVFQPEKLKEEAVNELSTLGAKLAIVVAYGNLIPKKLLDAVPMGFLNIHPSLLPKHRGASPITASILEGDIETGVCLMVLDEAMDHGPIIACRRLALKGDETTTSLRELITPLANELLNTELVEYIGGKMVSIPQNHTEATFCKLIESANTRISWRTTGVQIDRLVRAAKGVTPAWTTLDGITLLIHSVTFKPCAVSEEAGTIVKIKNSPAIATLDGYIIISELQLAGGKAMSGQAFLNGHKDFLAKTLV